MASTVQELQHLVVFEGTEYLVYLLEVRSRILASFKGLDTVKMQIRRKTYFDFTYLPNFQKVQSIKTPLSLILWDSRFLVERYFRCH